MVAGTAEREILRDGETVVEVARFETACGPRLRIRHLSESTEIYLDPFELEGLTRAPGSGFPVLGNGAEVPSPDESSQRIDPSEIFQNEFAMVQVAPLSGAGTPLLLIRDLASRAEVVFDPEELRRLTQLKHRQFAQLLDPSELVAAAEPDPDQV